MIRLTIILFFLSTISLVALSPEELQVIGDQQYEDGFNALAWANYDKAFKSSKDIKLSTSLLKKMSQTAILAAKQKDTIRTIVEFLKKNSKLKVEESSVLQLNSVLLLLDQKQYKEASKICQIILKKKKLIPKEVLSKTLETAVFALIKDSKLENASKLIEDNIASFPDQEKIELQNARIKILMSQYISAITILGKYLESKSSLPHFLALWAYLKSGDTNKAYEIFEKHLKLLKVAPDPAFTGILIKLAESTYKDKTAEAVLVLTKAEELEGNPDLKAYIALKRAELLILAEKAEEASEALETYLKQYPKSNKVLRVSLQLAELYYGSKKQDLPRATALLNSIVDANPQDKEMMYEALVMRAEVKQALGTLIDAAGDFTAAAELAQSQKMIADNISHPLHKAGLVKYLEASKTGVKEAFNDAANSFYSAASIKSSYRLKAALMQIQSLRKAESYTAAVQNVQTWLKIFPGSADLNYLLGITFIEDRKASEGLKALKKFILNFSKDIRVPMSYAYAISAAIYDPKANKLSNSAEKLVSEFERKSQTPGDLKDEFAKASPYILHLKAIFSWKNNYKIAAENYWLEFLNKYPSHSLSPEVYLWQAYRLRSSKNIDFNSAAKSYNNALSMLQESPLKGYALTQLGKTNRENLLFTEAADSLESAITVYKKLTLDDALTEELASLYFYTGDLYSRMGLYGERAIFAFSEAEKLTSHLNIKLAIKGRIADCHFAHAGLMRGLDELLDEFNKKMQLSIELYKEIYTDKNASGAIREQALYKLAKCHETLGNLKDKTHTNNDLAIAADYYKELFFNFHNDNKKDKKRDPYYFCRAGYDLARLHLNFDEKALLPAINTYRILAESGFPGTKDAAVMAKFLTEAQKNSEDE